MYKVLIDRGDVMLTWCSLAKWRAECEEHGSWAFYRASDPDGTWSYIRLLGFELSLIHR